MRCLSRHSLPSIQWHQHDSQYTSCKWTGGCSCCWRQTMICLRPFLLHSYTCGKMRLERPLRDLTTNSLGTIDFPMILSVGPPSANVLRAWRLLLRALHSRPNHLDRIRGPGSVKPRPKPVICWNENPTSNAKHGLSAHSSTICYIRVLGSNHALDKKITCRDPVNSGHMWLRYYFNAHVCYDLLMFAISCGLPNL